MLGEEEENMKDGMLKGVGQHPPSTDRRRQPRNQRARARVSIRIPGPTWVANLPTRPCTGYAPCLRPRLPLSADKRLPSRAAICFTPQRACTARSWPAFCEDMSDFALTLTDSSLCVCMHANTA